MMITLMTWNELLRKNHVALIWYISFLIPEMFIKYQLLKKKIICQHRSLYAPNTYLLH
jgi:hypothetical protein